MEIHVWRYSDVSTNGNVAQDRKILSPDELMRAARYRSERDQIRFITSRSWLRRILAAYVRRDPASLAFRVSRFGKPMLEDPSAPYFNLSHSHELAVCGVAGQSLGVDVEYVRPMPDALDIARHFFSPAEICALGTLPAYDLDAGFFRCWTRKEAFIKAIGFGLSMPLNSFSVSLDRDCAHFLQCSGSSRLSQWRLLNLRVSDQYAGAIAVRRGPQEDLRIIEMN